MYFNMRESNIHTMATNYKRVFYSVFLICLHVCPSVSEDVKDLDYFAYSRNRMIPADLVNVLSSFTGTLHQCAQTCRNSHQPSNITGTGSVKFGPCQAFEYIDQAGFCVLFSKKDNTGTSFDSLRPAAGTTFYEMAPSWSNLSLFIQTPKHVLSEDTAYYRLINSTTSEQCAKNCLDAPGIKCKSFAYSTNKKLCAFSKYDDHNHALIPAENYDFYRFRNDWPCNLTMGWKYATKVIASQGYPFITNESYSCFINIVPPKGKYVKLKLMERLLHINLCHDTNAGITVYGVTNGPLRICSETNDTTFSGRDGGNVTVFLSQKNTPFVTRINYEFEDSTPCREYRCFNGGTCQTKHGHAVCLCSGNFTGHLCDVDISACSSSPCLFGGHCTANKTGYTCTCLQGTTGINCELFIGKCYTKPCRNGNCTIASTSTGFRCACAPGFTGTTCEYEINECFSSPCLNGECRDEVNGYICECHEGFEGSNCEYKSGEYNCRPSDCKFGTCAMNVSGSYCQCFPGFYGKLCELSVNECESSPCKHGKCIDHVNAYACTCSAGFVGRHCDILLKNPCKINPCTNGYCSIDNNGFVCVCYKGFTGMFCEEIENTTPSSTSRSTTFVTPSITHPTTSHLNTIHSIKTHIPSTHAVFTTPSIASMQTDPSHTSTSTISVLSHVTLSIVLESLTTPNDLSTNARNVSSCNETKYCGAGTCLQNNGILHCLCPEDFTGQRCETKLSMCNRSTCVYGQCISGTFSEGSDHFNGLNSVCVCYQGYKGQKCDMTIHKPHENDTSVTTPTAISQTKQPNSITLISTPKTNILHNLMKNTPHNQISCDLLNPCKNYGACLKVNNTLQCVCRSPFTGVFCEVNMSISTSEITTSSVANVLHTHVQTTSSSLHNPDIRTTTEIPTTNISKTDISPSSSGDAGPLTAFTAHVTINVTRTPYTPSTHNFTTLKTRISPTSESHMDNNANITTETHKVTPIISTVKYNKLGGVDSHKNVVSRPTPYIIYRETARSTALSTLPNMANDKIQLTTPRENDNVNTNSESTTTYSLRSSKPTTGFHPDKSTGTDTVPKHINLAKVTKTSRSIPTTQVGELSRKTLAPVTTTISTTADEKPVDESSNHVITFESALIGGLSVALLAVICVAAVIGYRRNRSGTVYITSPRSSMKVKGTTDNTAVKKRFSSRDIYVEQRNSRYNNPYYTQKCVNQHRLTPRVKSATRSASSSTSDSTGSHSSNSTGEDYEQVQTESHMIQTESHVATHHSQSEESSSSTDNSFDRIIQRRSHSNDRLIRVTGNKAPPTTHGASGNTPSQQPHPHVPPFYQREDGSYVLNLNQSSSSVSPAEFHRVLDQLISSGKHKYTRPGTRQTVHQVSGVERGKSEA